MNCSKAVKSVLSVSGPAVALAMPKSMTLGTGTPSLTVTRMFEGLMSRWMMPFLFVQVFQAVLHAHHKGIIHSDIKPLNIFGTDNVVASVPTLIFLHNRPYI